jgi:peptide/nickel transport system permease protein
MARLLLTRLGLLVPVWVLVSVITFLLLHLVPGDPASVMLGAEATEESLQRVRERLGLDRPLPVQFAAWFGRVLRGDLGESYFLSRPVLDALLEPLPTTLTLASLALIIAMLIGIPAGIVAATRRNSLVDLSGMAVSLLGVSFPNFWIGLLLIFLFAVTLRWLPAGGYVPLGEDPLRSLQSLAMPAFSLGFAQAALLARITRSTMLEVLGQDYLRSARAKGVRERAVIVKHALRNTLIPVVTTIGVIVTILLSGSVVIETVFTLPGVGRLVVAAVKRRDYPVVQGAILLVSTIAVVVNLAVDLIYAVADPRLRHAPR